jgi:hypothetical protein
LYGHACSGAFRIGRCCGVTRSGGRCAGHSHDEKSGRQERADDGICPDPAIEFAPVVRRPFPNNVAFFHNTLRLLRRTLIAPRPEGEGEVAHRAEK